MEVNREITRIKSHIGVSKTLIIEGNVNDLFFFNNEYSNVRTVLDKLFEEKKFSDVFFFDIATGVTGKNLNVITELCEEFKIERVGGYTSLPNGYHNIQFHDNRDFFKIINKLMNPQFGVLNGIVMDYSNFAFGDNNLDLNERKNLVQFYKTLKESEFGAPQVGNLTSCLVFITQKINQLPPSVYLDNPDVVIVQMTKPTRDERKMFLNSIRANIKVIDLDQEFTNIVDAFDGWTLKEIVNFSKFSSNYPDKINFNNMLNIYNYGDKVSPWEELQYEKMQGVKEFLSRKVIGQEEAVDKVTKVLYKAYTGLTGVAYSAKRSKPKGTLFFVGPTGTGKTELAKAITTFLFNDESNLIRFDMSEYGQDNSDQKLIGAPPGYVGFEGGGQLTNAVKERPFSVILFDEIEKASPTIFDKFLQILEDGRLTDNTGQTVNFSETFIIFTSNIGANDVDPNNSKEVVNQEFILKVQEHFTNNLNRPELLGRFGNNIVPFNFISDWRIKGQIVNQKLKPIKTAVLEKYRTKLDPIFDEMFVKYVIKNSDEKRGGRDIINSLETNFVDPLSEFIFDNLNLIKDKTIKAQVINNKMEFSII